MIGIAENPAVIAPMKALTPNQRDCFVALSFYRHQRRQGGAWIFGAKSFAAATVSSLEERGLIRRGAKGDWILTQAGQIALDRLKGNTQ